MKVAYLNICGGMVYVGSRYGEMLFSKLSVPDYIRYLSTLKPDLLCIDEVSLELDGQSEMTVKIARALDLPYYTAATLSPSHLNTEKNLGLAIISRYPIASHDVFNIKAPKLEADMPDGSHWVLHDKGGLHAVIGIEGRLTDVFLFDFFPFHHFGRLCSDPEFADLRAKMAGFLTSRIGRYPVIIAGDMNNRGVSLEKAFPEVIGRKDLKMAVYDQTTQLEDGAQIDVLLYSKEHFTHTNGRAEKNHSDHYCLVADLKPRKARTL